MEIIEFLRYRLDEDEEVALNAGSDCWELDSPYLDAHGNLSPRRLGALRHMARHDPERVLREIEAKRLRVGAIERWLVEDPDDSTTLWLAKVEAQPFSDHPEWHQEWKP
jgi:hypothetical protein